MINNYLIFLMDYIKKIFCMNTNPALYGLLNSVSNGCY